MVQLAQYHICLRLSSPSNPRSPLFLTRPLNISGRREAKLARPPVLLFAHRRICFHFLIAIAIITNESPSDRQEVRVHVVCVPVACGADGGTTRRREGHRICAFPALDWTRGVGFKRGGGSSFREEHGSAAVGGGGVVRLRDRIGISRRGHRQGARSYCVHGGSFRVSRLSLLPSSPSSPSPSPRPTAAAASGARNRQNHANGKGARKSSAPTAIARTTAIVKKPMINASFE
ncbi:hypothetical protein BKA80DRAFT_268125 [Phyllosticta citrichinensis]